MYLLDTNVISELRKVRCDENVRAWVTQQRTESFYLSVVVLMELEYGIALMERRDALQGAMLRRWLHENVLPGFEGRLLDVSQPIALTCASLQAGGLRGLPDALIAATALEHRMSVVTRNTADFEGTGVIVINPWLAP